MQLAFSKDVFHLADLVEAPDLKGITRNRMLLQVGLEFLDVLEGNDTWRTGSSIEPMLNNDRTSGQRILYLRKACFGQKLGSFFSPVVRRVAIGNSFHRILRKVKLSRLQNRTPMHGVWIAATVLEALEDLYDSASVEPFV